MSSQPSDNTNSSRFLFDLFDYWRITDAETYEKLKEVRSHNFNATRKLLQNFSKTFPKQLLDMLRDSLKEHRQVIRHLKQLAVDEASKGVLQQFFEKVCSKKSLFARIDLLLRFPEQYYRLAQARYNPHGSWIRTSFNWISACLFEIIEVIFAIFLYYLLQVTFRELRYHFFTKKQMRKKKKRQQFKKRKELLDTLKTRGGSQPTLLDYANQIKAIHCLLADPDPTLITSKLNEIHRIKNSILREIERDVEKLRNFTSQLPLRKRDRLKMTIRNIIPSCQKFAWKSHQKFIGLKKSFQIIKTAKLTDRYTIILGICGSTRNKVKLIYDVMLKMVISVVLLTKMAAFDSTKLKLLQSYDNSNSPAVTRTLPTTYEKNNFPTDRREKTNLPAIPLPLLSSSSDRYVWSKYRIIVDQKLNLGQLEKIVQQPDPGSSLSPWLSPGQIVDLTSTVNLETVGIQDPEPEQIKTPSGIAERYRAKRDKKLLRQAEKQKLKRSFSQSNSQNDTDEEQISVNTTNPGERL